MNRQYKPFMWGGTSRRARTVVLTMLLGVFALTLAVPVPAQAGGILPPLGTAGSFGVLGSSTVTNTGPTTVRGDVGVSPGTAVTGFPPGIVNGTIHAGDATAAQAQNDVGIAYNNAASQACDVDLTGQNLGGLTLTPGVYCFASSAQLTGQLTLNGQGNPDSVFIFKVSSTFTTASNAQVLVINGVQPCRVFWQVGSSATLGTNTRFQGNILALTSITLTTGASTNTGLYALNGAVTLDTNDIQACSFVGGATPTSTAGVTNTSTATLTALPSTSTTTPVATNTPVPTSTTIPSVTNTPTNTVAATNTPIPTLTTRPTNTAIATEVPTSTPPITAGPTNTVTLSSPTIPLTGTPITTQTPGAPSATPTLPLPGETPTQTLATPTQIVTPPAGTLTETPTVAPQPTPEATATVGPPRLLPPAGGGLAWFGPFILLLSALLLVVGLGMLRLLRIRGES
ncbi:MAG: ice-binding family protein [Chloroflexia bacterium]